MNQTQRSDIVRAWMEVNQNAHLCQCGCGQFIQIKIHHHSRGIPRFVNGHSSKVRNPMRGRIGPSNPHFKEGRYVNQEGYVCVLLPGPGRSRYKLEHRLVMEQYIGRPLTPGEVVHHRNGDKQDNRIENLELTTNAAHSAFHANNGEVGFRKLKREGKRWRKEDTKSR